MQLGDILETVCQQLGLSLQELAAPGKGRAASQARALIAWLVRQVPELSLQEAAKRLGRDISSLSAAATRLERRVRQDVDLERVVARFRADLQIT